MLQNRQSVRILSFILFSFLILTSNSSVGVDSGELLLTKKVHYLNSNGSDFDDQNRCLDDVVASVQHLRSYGEIMGFHMHANKDATLADHWQGIQRLQEDNAQYMVVSRLLRHKTGEVHVVYMASRNHRGTRFRSNRMVLGKNPVTVAPPKEDRGIGYIVDKRKDGQNYNHAGGMQLLGNILAVPFEQTGQKKSRIYFYDMANPKKPKKISEEIERPSDPAGTVSFTKLTDGKFLLVAGGMDADKLDFYFSAHKDIRHPGFSSKPDLTWNHETATIKTTIGDAYYGDYQNLNFINQCDGALFLIGSHWQMSHNKDWIDLFRVTIKEGNVELTKVAKKQVHCDTDLGRAQCNLDAAGGVYIDSQQNLLFYATEHENEGPGQFGTVKFVEFRSVPHGTCSKIEDAWVELYEDKNFAGRSVILDWIDKDKKSLSNFRFLEQFGDKVSSVQYCLPKGRKVELYENDSYKGEKRIYTGTGTMQGVTDLHDDHFGDKASSLQWY